VRKARRGYVNTPPPTIKIDRKLNEKMTREVVVYQKTHLQILTEAPVHRAQSCTYGVLHTYYIAQARCNKTYGTIIT
jgi:hypothetical protein